MNHATVDNPNRWSSEGGFYGLGADEGSSWVDAFKETLPVIASVYQQREFNKMNQALINTGKAPLSADQYMRTQAPTATVDVGSQTQKLVLYVGLGVLALVGLRAAKVI